MKVRQLAINSAIYTILLNIHLVASTVKVQWAWYHYCAILCRICVYMLCVYYIFSPHGVLQVYST